MKNKTYILSLGGSLISTKAGINRRFLKKFRDLIIKYSRQGNKFIIITGGGAVCRDYQQAAREITALNKSKLDWIGINTTIFHAQFLKILFGEKAYSKIITNPTIPIKTNKKIIIGAGWKPGCSTDQDAVLSAKQQKADTIINLSNIDYAYTKDPKKYSDAKKITRASWRDFRKIIGNKWDPGLNLPFDPIASKTAQQAGIKVIITNGKKLNNLEKIFRQAGFKGTLIE